MYFIFPILLESVNLKYGLYSQSDSKDQKWSMFSMATALGHRDLCQSAWDGMSSKSRTKSIFDVFESESKMNRIIGDNIRLFADFVLRLLRDEDSVLVEFMMDLSKLHHFPVRIYCLSQLSLCFVAIDRSRLH